MDRVCKIDYRAGWSLQQWLTALRAETVRVEEHIGTVVLYLEKSLTFEDVPPLKNGLQAIFKVIRQHNRNCRIFISNLLSMPSNSPIGKPRVQSNFILLQAVRSINRILRKVHFLTVYEHFVSHKGKILRPTHHYFQENGQLTPLGCMVLRECFLREAGHKTYWF